MSISSMSNYVRSILFANSMSLVDLIVLVTVCNRFKIWIAIPMYLFWAWMARPILAKAVGASPAELAEQAAKSKS